MILEFYANFLRWILPEPIAFLIWVVTLNIVAVGLLISPLLLFFYLMGW